MRYRKRKQTDFYQYRPNWYGKSKQHQVDFREWLLANGADIHAKLEHNELFKFTMNGHDGFVWITGICCGNFRKYLKMYKKELNQVKKLAHILKYKPLEATHYDTKSQKYIHIDNGYFVWDGEWKQLDDAVDMELVEL